MSAPALPVVLLSTEALRQRRAELLTARQRLDVELQRITGVLRDRAPGPKPRPRVRHGTEAGYRRHLRDGTAMCDPCRAAHTAVQRSYRDAKRARTTEPTITPPGADMPTPFPKIARPRIDLAPGPRGLVFAVCKHCPWQYGPAGKSFAQERAMGHRNAHRAGLIEVES